MKGLWDTRQEKIDLLVTGSGRLDLYQRGGDSLPSPALQHFARLLGVKHKIHVVAYLHETGRAGDTLFA